MTRKLIDIHIHSSLKPYNNFRYEGQNPTIWQEFPYQPNFYEDPILQLNTIIRSQIKEIARISQTNLDKFVPSNIRCLFISLYPAERPFFDSSSASPLIRAVLPKRKDKYLAQTVTGFPIRKVEKILKKLEMGEGEDDIDYFKKELLPLIEYVVNQNNTNGGGGFTFKIATNYDEFEQYTKHEEKTIACILTIEGANTLGNYPKNDFFKKEYDDLSAAEKDTFAQTFRDNINALKNLKINDISCSPFFISFSHHFNNLLAGHSRSLSNGMKMVLNQDCGQDLPFNELGREVMELLLDKSEGRRILIDTKHMSIAARVEYHQYVKEQPNDDPIPIICSHAAINGWSSFEESKTQGSSKKLDKGAYFSRWEINLNDEEILDIYDSDGLIGIVLHEGRMPGGEINKRTKPFKKILDQYKDDPLNPDAVNAKKELTKIYVELIWSNIFHIVRLIHEKRQTKDGWKIIALGSDYGGAMNPFDTFDSVDKFQELTDKMIDYFNYAENPIYFAINGDKQKFERSDLINLLDGKQIEDRIDEIFFNNVDHFLSKYFT